MQLLNERPLQDRVPRHGRETVSRVLTSSDPVVVPFVRGVEEAVSTLGPLDEAILTSLLQGRDPPVHTAFTQAAGQLPRRPVPSAAATHAQASKHETAAATEAILVITDLALAKTR